MPSPFEPFIHDDFLLATDSARHLYHSFAANQPIIDYHNHLPPNEIAENRRFNNLYEIWLEGDHYKWRAMRANGVAEEFCTGDADPYEKYLAFARTVPKTLRNPLYHWTHLELKRYFGIDELLNGETAKSIWDRTSEMLASDELSVWGILNRFRVKALCTTDDPCDNLADHRRIAETDLPTRVYPAFRPDRALTVDQPELFNPWVDRLAEVTDAEITSVSALLDALKSRHNFFHEMGARVSDHGLPHCYGGECTDAEADRIFRAARNGNAVDAADHHKFASYLMLFFGRLDAEKGWVKQLHLGPKRNNSTRIASITGPDGGLDSMGDWLQMDEMAAYFDRLDRENALPKTVVYNLNPSWNYAVATMVANFNDGSLPGKMQFGSGWWYLDQKEGMEMQLNTLSNVGLLSRFIGMLTDSRSFMSFPRHEYFRRTLCNLIGQDVTDGLLPNDDGMLGQLIEDICFRNVRNYLDLNLTE